MKDAPIFVNSLFRSASTYIYNAFLRAESEKYFCFQEPLHEAVWLNRNTPGDLNISDTAGMQRSLHHPEMSRGYYDSMIETHDAWRKLIKDDFGYANAFETENVADEVKFFKALAKASTARPVFQECRLSWRAGALKSQLDGIYIHLWRNPRDQWWSYKTTPYFSGASRLLASAQNRPQLVQWALDVGDIPLIPDGGLQERLDFATVTPPAPEASYRLHYAMWIESQRHLNETADIDISIDCLSEEESYRDTILSQLEAHGVSGLDFSDCSISRAEFSHDEYEFFEHIEKSVETHALEFGCDQDVLAAIIERKKPGQAKSRRLSALNQKFADDASRARKIALSVENQTVKQREATLTAGGGIMAFRSALISARAQFEQEFEKRASIQAAEIGRLHHAYADQQASLDEANKHAADVSKLKQEFAERAIAQAAEIGRLNHACVDRQGKLDETIKQNAKIAENYETAFSHLRVQSTRDQNQISRLITEMRSARENWAERADHYEKALHHYRHHSVLNERAIVSLRQAVSDKTQRVDALEQSTSWRMTAPVRFVSKAFSFRNWLSSAKALARKTLEKGLVLVRAIPGASKILWGVARLVPPVHRKLQHFASVRGVHVPGDLGTDDHMTQDERIPAPGSVIDPTLAASLRHYVQTSYGTAALSQQRDQAS